MTGPRTVNELVGPVIPGRLYILPLAKYLWPEVYLKYTIVMACSKQILPFSFDGVQ